jgi:hypothetical protein
MRPNDLLVRFSRVPSLHWSWRKKGQHTPGIVPERLALKLSCSFPPPRTHLCPLVWPQIMLRSRLMMGEACLLTDKYHKRKGCQDTLLKLKILFELSTRSRYRMICITPYYRGSIEVFNTKIGLSSGAVIGLSSLRDELTGLEAQPPRRYPR